MCIYFLEITGKTHGLNRTAPTFPGYCPGLMAKIAPENM
jgi:hypothetical protein